MFFKILLFIFLHSMLMNCNGEEDENNYVGNEDEGFNNNEDEDDESNEDEGFNNNEDEDDESNEDEGFNNNEDEDDESNEDEGYKSGDDEKHKSGDDEKHESPSGAPNLKETINEYKMAYYNSFVYKFISLEFETYNNQSRGPELFRKECLRLEHLYFTKWAKNYLTEQNEADKNLLRLYEDKFERAVNENRTTSSTVDFHGRLQNSISSKWKAREHLDKVEHKHFAQSNRNNNRNKNELEENLLNTEAEVSSKLQKIKELEAKAVKAANEYRRNSNNKEFLDEYNKSGQKLNGALYTLADMIGEAENARVQLFEILPSVERIKRLLSAMENEANMCN
uniref:Uncharacterized protein n=2 Tax=Schistosoma japonicum TaxID=6182 RepID=C1LN57_SCHJA|nr:hypothetical protein [Schistosoma japonicum]